MIQIANDHLSATICRKGAELRSLQLNGLEYLWQADAEFWPKHSPVLFPIVGELKDGKYIFNNKEYQLSRHGFARDKVFEASKISDAATIFTLQSNEDTLIVYPFPFIFQVQYEITNNELECTYKLQNVGDGDMYFSVGGHPAFKVPLSTQLQYTDYALKFEHDAILKRYILHNGCIGDDVKTIHLNNNELLLDPSLFYTDAIVLKNINSKKVKLYTHKDIHGLILTFEGFPYFGIWAAKDAPFVCLEPWCGIADHVHHDHQLTTKEGINKLPSGEKWERKWSVALF